MSGPGRYSGFPVLAVAVLSRLFYMGLPGGSNAWAADVNTLIFEGTDYHYRGDIGKAVQRFEQALQLDPGNEFAHNQRAALCQARTSPAFSQGQILFEKTFMIEIMEASCRNQV